MSRVTTIDVTINGGVETLAITGKLHGHKPLNLSSQFKSGVTRFGWLVLLRLDCCSLPTVLAICYSCENNFYWPELEL